MGEGEILIIKKRDIAGGVSNKEIRFVIQSGRDRLSQLSRLRSLGRGKKEV